MLENVMPLKWGKYLATAILPALLLACGGGGSDTGCSNLDPNRSSSLPGCGTSTNGGTTASTVQLLVTSQQLNSAGTSSDDVTVIARDANGQALSGRTVQFTVSDPENTAYISNFSQTTGTSHATGTDGQLTATLNVGSSKSNRAITLNATIDKATASTVINVSGTTLAVSGNNVLAHNAQASLSVVVSDSAGKPLVGIPVKATSANGNLLSLSSSNTDINGKMNVTVSGTKDGADTLTFSAAGASASYAITVGANGFAFTSPASGATLTSRSTVTVSVRWTKTDGSAEVGKTIRFTTTRGTLASAQEITNGNGEASTTLVSDFTGPATITASDSVNSGVVGSMNVTFVSNAPVTALNLQADKSTVSINTAGSTANVVTLTAVARDTSNNRVAGAAVNFHIDQDLTGGALTIISATTDNNGIARAQYVPTNQSSATNGVQISAAIADNSVHSTPVALTVAAQNLFVRIGTDNTVGISSPNYTKQYSAFVTDAAGNPVPDAKVVFQIRPRQEVIYDSSIPVANFLTRGAADYAYYKGYMVWNDTSKSWQPLVTFGCYNEDVNANGILETGEDYNNNGVLDPGNVFSVNGNAATNASGFALATITYPKDHAYWINVTLSATAQVSGTEASASATFTLPGAVEDYNKQAAAPPGAISPYGQNACNSPQ